MSPFPSAILLAGLACLASSGTPAPVSTGGIQYFADAHGSSANTADTVLAGKSALVTLGTCGTLRAPVTKTNTVAAVNAPPALFLGNVDTSASALESGRTRTARSGSAISSVNVLSRLITARDVLAASATSRDDSGFHTSAAGSGFSGLTVAGRPFFVAPAPNTRVDLPGIGFVVLNEQIRDFGAASASLTVNMIHVSVTLPNPLAAVGTDIVVGHAKSRLVLTDIAGTLGGFAFGTLARVERTFLAGYTAPVQLGCLGTNGQVKTETVGSVVSPPEFVTSLVRNTASGVVTSTSATGETTSTVEAAEVLSSLVTADVVHAEAHAFTDGSVFSFSTQGSSFVNLSVSGFPQIGDQVALNTRVSIAGLGTLWLKREIRGPNGIEMRMIELVVLQENAFGLPVGTSVQVAVAHVTAR